MTVTSQAQPNAATVVTEEAARSVPLVAQATAPKVGRTEGDAVGGSPGVVAVVERISRESLLALTLGGSHSPMRGEPLLQLTDPQDPTSTLFSLNDATKIIERETLNEGISVMLEALNQAMGVL